MNCRCSSARRFDSFQRAISLRTTLPKVWHLAAARESVNRSIASAYRLAAEGIRNAVECLTKAGHEVCGCGVLVGTGMPPLEHRRNTRSSRSHAPSGG